MNEPLSIGTAADRIEQEAGRWLERQDFGDLTPDEQCAFTAWLAQSTVHRVTYVRLAAAWNLKRPWKPGRLETLCAGSEVVVLRNDFRPETCRAPLVLTGRDFDRGGSAELYRLAPDRWRITWAQDLRGRRPWTWGPDPR